jgi:tetratricopeptide (TPR) repeat protein
MPTADELYRQADQLKDAGKYQEAIDKLNEILAADAQHVLSHLTLAVLHGKVGQHDKAVEHGERAIQLEPNDAFNFTALSVTYQRAYAGTNNMRYIQLAEEAKARAATMAGHCDH